MAKKPAKSIKPKVLTEKELYAAVDQGANDHKVSLQDVTGLVVKSATMPAYLTYPRAVVHKGRTFTFWGSEDAVLIYREVPFVPEVK